MPEPIVVVAGVLAALVLAGALGVAVFLAFRGGPPRPAPAPHPGRRPW